MRWMVTLLWLAAFVQFAIVSANFFLPGILRYRENLKSVSPIIRQMFVVHTVYIVGIVLLFAIVTLGFAGELASGRGLGRFLCSSIAIFWLFRVPIQISYYDPELRRTNRLGDFAFTTAALFLTLAYGVAALKPSL